MLSFLKVGAKANHKAISAHLLTRFASNASYNGPSFEKATKLRQQLITPSAIPYYRNPVLIHKGEKQYLYDHKGTKYLDMFGGIVTVSVGHCHPKVNQALEEQLNTLWHTTSIYMHPKIYEYAERLTSKLPGDLKVVYFVNSGSEANDLATLLLRLYTKNFDIVTLKNAYHGGNMSSMGLTAQSTWHYNLPSIGNGVHHAMNADPYVGLWGGRNCRDSPVQTNRNCDCTQGKCLAEDNYINQLEAEFKYSLPKGKCAGMIVESIQGGGGIVQFPRNYVKRAIEMVHENGGLFVSDEVQTGFGRTGEHYWGFEMHGIVPDVVTMAKGIGNGFPLAAVVTTPEISQVLTEALHFNTFGGNPLACAVGMAVLDVIDEENLQQNSLEVGTYLLKGLENLRDKYEVVGDVRGKGLMIGVELVESKSSKSPLNTASFIDIWESCKDMGVLLGKGGISGNVFRIQPPMCITKEDADLTLNVLEASLKNQLNN
ncbi:CLUMA_CG011122, isoform A [Clunio marinus]|uniref:Alanine--glyoxylate aminotransferase 2, mitochondrial n=1 Tax=Clunio marinus TaxID=568069 RepID=A0A1J1IBT4_9DIPT|nr:CLUMA_CG011122, isoform A [Clunio marinus]